MVINASIRQELRQAPGIGNGGIPTPKFSGLLVVSLTAGSGHHDPCGTLWVDQIDSISGDCGVWDTLVWSPLTSSLPSYPALCGASCHRPLWTWSPAFSCSEWDQVSGRLRQSSKAAAHSASLLHG